MTTTTTRTRTEKVSNFETERVDGGVLVFRNNPSELGSVLVGFSHPDDIAAIDWSAIRAELARKGLGVGAVHQTDVYEPSEVGL